MKDTLPRFIDHPERVGHETADTCPASLKEHPSVPMNWQVYIILCSDKSLYTGITTDLTRRLRQHAAGRGAKYFRGRRPEKVLYLETGHTRSTASRREAEIKTLTHADKCFLASTERNEMVDAQEPVGLGRLPGKLPQEY
jgi:putative endonuclease